MNDQAPFTPFQQAETKENPPAEKVDRRKGPRGTRKHGAAKRGRPARPAEQRAAPREAAVRASSLSIAVTLEATAGLTDDDAAYLIPIVKALEVLDAGQRSRVVKALGKLFP